MEKSGAACTDLMVAGQAVPFSIGFFSHLVLVEGCLFFRYEAPVQDNTDIQEIGEVEETLESVSYSRTDWSPTHRVPALADARAVIWTRDNQYSTFRVILLAEHRAAHEWKRLRGGAKLAANVCLSHRHTSS